MATAKNKLCLVVCENLAREITAALTLEGLDDIVVAMFAGRCGSPQVDAETLDQAARIFRHYGPRVCLVGSCGSADLASFAKPGKKNSLYRVGSCPELFINKTLHDDYVRTGALVLTPGEVGDRLADRERWPELASATRLVLLDTGVDEESVHRVKDLAQSVDLPYEVVPVGLDYLRLFLSNSVREWRLEEERNRSRVALSEAIRRSSDHALALDLVGTLARIATEAEAVESIMELFTILFAPGMLIYSSYVDGKVVQIHTHPPSMDDTETTPGRLVHLQGDYVLTESGNGFILRIDHQEETLGILEIDEIALSQHLDHYLNLALILAKVCGLAIANARAYEQRRQAEDKIRHQAYHDTLTGLPNRQLFNDHLSLALEQARRRQHNLAVLFIDLDDFKHVNDQLGHDIGDQLLQLVADRLQGAVRTGDTVARMGGDEFLLLLPRINRPEDALHVAHRILDGLRPPCICSGHAIHVAASIGITLFPQDGQDVEVLVKRADTAMYWVKQRGKNGYQLYGEGEREGDE